MHVPHTHAKINPSLESIWETTETAMEGVELGDKLLVILTGVSPLIDQGKHVRGFSGRWCQHLELR